MRLQEIQRLLRSFMPGIRIIKTRHERHEALEIVFIDAMYAGYRIIIREIWIGSVLKRYGYQLLHGETPLLRYDNAPHHPELDTSPHHRHIGSHVEPLKDYSLEAFLEESCRLMDMSCRRPG